MTQPRCPWCDRAMAAMTLRQHVALDVCGQVPPGACVAFAPGEARATSEDTYRQLAERVGRANGWLVSHVERAQPRAGRWTTPAAPGFPDTWFVHGERAALLVVEFKAEKGRTNPKLQALQQAWLEAIAAVPGAKAMRSRPSGWPDLQAALNPP